MINLLSPEIKLQYQINRRFRTLLALFAFVFLLIALIWGTIYFLEQDLIKKNQLLVENKSQIDKDSLKYKTLESDVNQINDQLKVINGIVGQRFEWSGILAKLASLTPQAIKINTLAASPGTTSATNKNSQPQFSISGNAKTLEDIETFRKSLDESKVFYGSTFKSASLNNSDNTFTFNLATTVLSKQK